MRTKYFLTLIFIVIIVACNNKDKDKVVAETKEWIKALVEKAIPDRTTTVWIPTGDFKTSSLLKIPRYPRIFSEEELNKNIYLKEFLISDIEEDTLYLDGIKGEQISAQLGVISKESISKLSLDILSLYSEKGDSIPASNISIRYVGYVALERAKSEYEWSAKLQNIIGADVSGDMNPDLVADPLYKLASIDVPSYTSQPIWITIKTPKNIPSGKYTGLLSLKGNNQEIITKKISVKLIDGIGDSLDEFFLDMWFNPYAIANFYGYPLWGKKHWEMVKIYLKDLASRGNKTITTTIVDSPWLIESLDKSLKSQNYSPYGSMVKWIRTEDGGWNFDYSIFDKYVQTSIEIGVSEIINAFSMTNFSGKERLYFFDELEQKDIVVVLDSITDSIYKEVWPVFLNDFKNHLKAKNWLKRTYLSFDERPQEVMAYIFDIIRKNAPEFLEKISIAGHPESDVYSRGALSISYEFFPNQNLYKKETIEVIANRNKNNEITTFYLSGQPEHPNTLTYSPAIEAQMIPMLTLKHNVKGYVRWAYCNWTDNPIKNPVFNYNQGDEYIVYPGKKGPISTIRWELFKEGVEDYELLALIKRKKILTLEQQEKILEIYTQTLDGRKKSVLDIKKAKDFLYGISSMSDGID